MEYLKRSRDYLNHRFLVVPEKILTEIDWKTLFISSECVNSIVDVFHNVLSHCFFACFPLRSTKVSSVDKPWVTPQIKLLMHQKDRAFHRGHKIKYLAFRDRLVKALDTKKRSNFSKNLSGNKSNSKHMWNLINKNFRNNSNSNLPLSNEKVLEINE